MYVWGCTYVREYVCMFGVCIYVYGVYDRLCVCDGCMCGVCVCVCASEKAVSLSCGSQGLNSTPHI